MSAVFAMLQLRFSVVSLCNAWILLTKPWKEGVYVSTCFCSYRSSWMYICWLKWVHTVVFTSPLGTPQWPSPPELLTDAWHQARTQTCCFCVFFPHLSPPCRTTPNSAQVAEEFCSRWALDLETQSHLFTGTSQTHQIQKEPSFDRREPWKLAETTRPSF